MVYDPTLLREEVAARAPGKDAAPGFGLASSDNQYNPKVLPRRLMGDEPSGRFYKLASPEFAAAFEKASAHWLSRDCHRSQYGYPFRLNTLSYSFVVFRKHAKTNCAMGLTHT